MSLTRIRLDQFTAFKELDLKFSPGINVLVGANGTGKTHVLKVCYAACEISKSGTYFTEKLVNVLLPSQLTLGRLVRRKHGRVKGSIQVFRDELCLDTSFSNHFKSPYSAAMAGAEKWLANPIAGVYIPVKEMLSNAPGFRSLHANREIHFEEIYVDILHRAFLPQLRGPVDKNRRDILTRLKEEIGGTINYNNEEFFLSDERGFLEFTLLAEGIRKLSLLWLLIQNGSIQQGSVLFWDEPETNLNPKLFGLVIEILLMLQRGGVQIFLATHDYVILKELDLQQQPGDEIAFHALYHDPCSGGVTSDTTHSYLGIHPNAIAETYSGLYDREVQRNLAGLAS